ncbi:hypothetical protein CJ030_MR5G004858 [Morella rubra]|uniref:Uncharacterized protein n=1 Tax=Morella rubra TaxID=262757 RepID=A0A6A1VM69_9ROSI|nr:hypothetical protein CJ030_MR5G004858 [Morella rubra]
MGKKSSSFCSICSIFKACFSGGNSSDDYGDEGVDVRRICPSDYDRGLWIGEPGIDRRATAFIDRFYATRVSDPEHRSCPP